MASYQHRTRDLVRPLLWADTEPAHRAEDQRVVAAKELRSVAGLNVSAMQLAVEVAMDVATWGVEAQCFLGDVAGSKAGLDEMPWAYMMGL